MKLLIALLLCLALPTLALAQRDAFNVRYLGGSVETKTDKEDWKNKLTVRSDEIRLELKDGQKVSIDPHSVTSISYGRGYQACRQMDNAGNTLRSNCRD